jgi:hypothetical protein
MSKFISSVIALLAVVIVPATVVADEPSRAEKIIAKADKELAAEAAKLMAAGKQAESDTLLTIAKSLNDYVMPLSKPGDAAKLRMKLLAQKLVATWERPAFPDKYVFFADGTAIAKGPAGNEVNRGQIRVVSAEQADVAWNSGHIWSMFLAGTSRLAVDERFGGDFVNDGIVLSRSR